MNVYKYNVLGNMNIYKIPLPNLASALFRSYLIFISPILYEQALPGKVMYLSICLAI